MRTWRREASSSGETVTGVDLDRPGAPRRWIAPGEPIISLRGVTKCFGSHTVLEDVTFDVPKGRTTAIMGPSGTGKSVLLKNILGLLRPERGEIWVDGEQIVGMRERRLYEVRRKFGVLFQDGALFGSMDLYDNIAFSLREHSHKNERQIREIVLRNAELVGLVDHLKKLPGEVSGGMKKRAGLARAMVTEPDIVLFDEPDSGLDPVRVAYLDDLVVTAQRETGATFFIITHNIESVMRVADYMGVLFRSHLVKFASKAEMRASDDPVIRQFLSGRAEGPIGMDEMADSEDYPYAPAAAGPGAGGAARGTGASGGPGGRAVEEPGPPTEEVPSPPTAELPVTPRPRTAPARAGTGAGAGAPIDGPPTEGTPGGTPAGDGGPAPSVWFPLPRPGDRPGRVFPPAGEDGGEDGGEDTGDGSPNGRSPDSAPVAANGRNGYRTGDDGGRRTAPWGEP